MKVLMTCHDDNIDRRIIAQAESLIALGCQVTILGLTAGSVLTHERKHKNLLIVRISQEEIRKFNSPKGLKIKANILPRLINYLRYKFRPIFRLFIKINTVLLPRLINYLRYRLKSTFKPFLTKKTLFDFYLPFTKPFFEIGRNFEYDLIQVHDLPTLPAGLKLAKLKSVPLVYDAHELYPEQHVFTEIQKKTYDYFESVLIKKCDLIFAVNQSIAKKMAEYYQINQPITLINAVDAPNNFIPHQQYNLLRERLNISSSKKIVLFQGGFSPYRQLESLIESMALVENQNIVLVLMGSGDIRQELINKAEALGLLNNKIYFHDAVPQDDLIYYSASADMGIIPYPHIDLNSYYCTPNKLFEFIQAELPMIGNDSPELCRYISGEGFGMNYLMDGPHSIAKAIDQGFDLLETANWKENLKEKSYLFSWKNISQIYVDAMKPYLSIHQKKDETTCVV